jgi:hypothetical protein
MSRRPYRPRPYLYECPKCDKWCSVPTSEMQQECRAAGACPRCQHDAAWLARVKVAAIEEHMARLVTLGKAAPEAKKATLRAMYVKKQQQLATARAALAAVGQTAEVEAV